jgi:hypothetical protein
VDYIASSAANAAFTWASLLQSVPAYLHLRTTWQAVILPLLLAAWLWRSDRRALPEFTGTFFVIGTAISIGCSVFRDTGAEQSLHTLPGYALLLTLTPIRYLPSWRQSYALGYLSMLLADLYGAGAHFYAHGDIPADFYCGVGGAGLGDALCICPTWLPLMLGLRGVLERKQIGHLSMTQCLQAITGKLRSAASRL